MPTKKLRVLFLTKYDRLAANTRYRCLQFIPYLEKDGVECHVSPLLNDDYLTYKFAKGGVRIGAVARAYWKRFRVLTHIRDYDAVVLHYEIFPYFPAFFEYLFKLAKVKYVFDYDDAIFHQYDIHPNFFVRAILRNKISKVIKYSSAVLAGNEYLAKYASNASKNSKVSIVPTVVDPAYYHSGTRPAKRDPKTPFTIGWIGSPSTASYVKEMAQALRLFCLKYHAQVVLVGSGPISIPGVPLVLREWSEENELKELAKFDVGIMPLPDDPWTRGKCGFKLIQYMASGLPTVASPVGVNTELVKHGETGYLASTTEDWVNSLEELYHNPEKRAEMGRKGFAKVVGDYSLPVYAPKLTQVLRDMHSPETHVEFPNIDTRVIRNFGLEWMLFPQTSISDTSLKSIFDEYFQIFDWKKISKENSVGADIGCGSGRWAKFVAPQVKELHCVEPSMGALGVAKRNLSHFPNVNFHHASVGNLPFEDGSLDFAYCIGVLHHIPDTIAGIREIARKLKSGGLFHFYIYYAFDNRSQWYKGLWKVSDLGRVVISRLPFALKIFVSQLIAMTVYWPLARTAKLFEWLGFSSPSWTLGYYRDKGFYVMRTDALDRFGTRLEKRFTKDEIRTMLSDAGFINVKFSEGAPYWVGVAEKKG